MSSSFEVTFCSTAFLRAPSVKGVPATGYKVELRWRPPKMLPAAWGIWHKYRCLPENSELRFFSKNASDPNAMIRPNAKLITECDGVEPIAEDIRIVTLRKNGRMVAWLKFGDVGVRNAFILAARPILQTPSLYPKCSSALLGSPWSWRCFISDMKKVFRLDSNTGDKVILSPRSKNKRPSIATLSQASTTSTCSGSTSISFAMDGESVASDDDNDSIYAMYSNFGQFAKKEQGIQATEIDQEQQGLHWVRYEGEDEMDDLLVMTIF